MIGWGASTTELLDNWIGRYLEMHECLQLLPYQLGKCFSHAVVCRREDVEAGLPPWCEMIYTIFPSFHDMTRLTCGRVVVATDFGLRTLVYRIPVCSFNIYIYIVDNNITGASNIWNMEYEFKQAVVERSS